MKMCQPHWDALRKAIEDRGLYHLVAKDGKTAIDNLKAELEGRGDKSNYDPLMTANLMICDTALQMGGLYLLNGEHCPLCEAAKHLGANAPEVWINGCTDSILEYCQKHGIVGQPSRQGDEK